MSEKRMTPIKQGDLVLISTGCYSDYSVQRVCRATRDIDVEAEIDEFLEKHSGIDLDAFGSELMSYLDGALEETMFRELHLGDYKSCPQEMWLTNILRARSPESDPWYEPYESSK